MSRLLLAAGLLAAAGPSVTPAQDKKDPPKKKERIAVADPKAAAKDPDFIIQGEYAGEITVSGAKIKTGSHVVAKGGGAFDVKMYAGGLPGAGWDQKTVTKYAATTAEGKVAVLDERGKAVGGIASGTLILKVGDGTLDAKKVWRELDTLGKKPPEGAVVLFGKEGDEKYWTNGRLLDPSDGKFLTVATVGKQGGNLVSREKFGAFKAHVEFRTPWMPNSAGQQRGNSGVYLQDRYELQVLDSFGLSGENNECGGIYQQHKPLVNMCLPPLAWQTYDIESTPAVFDGDKKVKPARATIFHNGVKIHDNVEFKGPTGGGQKEEPTPGPLQFQNHGDPVVFRNVWVVPAK